MTLAIQSAFADRLAATIKRNNLDLQFGAYEGGNLIAAIGGAGGLSAIAADMAFLRDTAGTRSPVWHTAGNMAAGYPELTIVVSILLVAIVGPILRAQVMRLIGGGAKRAIGMGSDVVLTGLALTILVYGIMHAAAPIACAAAAFVVSSALFRQSATRPIFLKLGAGALTVGGVFLALTGLADLSADLPLALPLLTACTGGAVILASLLAYEGGIHACRAAPEAIGPLNGLWDWLLHSRDGLVAQLLSTVVDGPVMAFNRLARKTLLLPIPRETRATRPFVTAMWIRLPWRMLTFVAAVAVGAWVFAIANMAWAMGDVSLASIDWKPPSP